ncbi:hypothetical protein ACFWZT_32050 [Streptomyces alboflavus]|uniref:hypothetical protein n=1 Tax=Streptomyces alboflavus TaxID=67267 RepID=UPI0036A112EF
MTGAQLPEGPGRGRRAELPAGGNSLVPRRPEPLEVVPSLHEPGGFPVDDSFPDRQACWDMLGAGVKDRLRAKAGTVVEWWARVDHEGRVRATVFGTDGLCRATPVVRNGKWVYLVERLRLEPGAMRRQSFDGAAPESRAPGWSRVLRRPAADSHREQQPSSAVVARPLSLDDETRGVLGNFPVEVQEFLQRPFVRDDRRVFPDWYYDETVEFAHQRVFVVFCLSADRHVTVASGTRILPRGRSLDRAQWDIECTLAPVRRT